MVKQLPLVLALILASASGWWLRGFGGCENAAVVEATCFAQVRGAMEGIKVSVPCTKEKDNND